MDWIRRFILLHGKRHLNEMGAPKIEAFFTNLAVNENVAASTQNQALSALLFLYREVFHKGLGLIDTLRARKPKCLPTVLTKDEVRRVARSENLAMTSLVADSALSSEANLRRLMGMKWLTRMLERIGLAQALVEGVLAQGRCSPLASARGL